MDTELILVAPPVSTEIGPLAQIADRASDFAQHSKSKNTIRAYRADWMHFEGWCQSHDLCALPATANSVGLYLADISSSLKPGTLTRRLSSISQAHYLAEFPSPTVESKVRLVMAGIRRTMGTAQTAKTPILIADLRKLVDQLPENILGIRDRALLLVGFAGGFRRSELTGLDRDDVEITREGLTVMIRRSKVDQEGQGRKIGIPYGSNPDTCPVRAFQAWLDASATTEGAIFRPITRHGKIIAHRLSGNAVASVVKTSVTRIGLDARKMAGHSLRSGLATSAAMAGVSERSIALQTGHKSLSMLRRYIRDGSLFRDNAAGQIGL